MARNWDDRAAFCPVCGLPLELREVFGARRKCCTACDYVQFRSPAGAVVTLVARGREVLLVRRGIDPFRGCWGLPGGFQDYDESPMAAALRETREETGLEVRIIKLLDVCYTTDDPRKRSNVIVYLAESPDGTPRPGDDAAEARFFSLDELPAKIAFENNRILLARLQDEFPTGAIR